MAQARQRAEWERTSWLMALTANCHRDPKKNPQPFRPDDLNPYGSQHGQRRRRTRGLPITADSVSMLKVFVKSNK